MPHKRQRSRSSSKASFPSKKHKLDKQQKRLTKRSRYPKASSLRQAESAAFSDSHNKPSNSGDAHEGSSHTDNEMDVDTTTKRWRRYSPSSIKTTNSSDVGTSHSNETGSHGKGNKTSSEEHRPDAWSYFDRAAGEGFHSSCAVSAVIVTGKKRSLPLLESFAVISREHSKHKKMITLASSLQQGFASPKRCKLASTPSLQPCEVMSISTAFSFGCDVGREVLHELLLGVLDGWHLRQFGDVVQRTRERVAVAPREEPDDAAEDAVLNISRLAHAQFARGDSTALPGGVKLQTTSSTRHKTTTPPSTLRLGIDLQQDDIELALASAPMTKARLRRQRKASPATLAACTTPMTTLATDNATGTRRDVKQVPPLLAVLH
ncbi:hypothetical protein EXIGLDRAFT_749905, partial [Exidia glandulosa HHB12029]